MTRTQATQIIIVLAIGFGCGVLTMVIGQSVFDELIDDEIVVPPAPEPLPVEPPPAEPDDPIIRFILEREGGYTPSDPSYEGVYQPTWEWFRKAKNKLGTPQSVKDLEAHPELIEEFYMWYLYELRSGLSVMPDWFKLMHADWWTTSMSKSIRPLQKRAGVEVDGVWGKHTEELVIRMFDQLESPVEFARWYTNERISFYKSLGYDEHSGLVQRAELAYAKTLKLIQGEAPPSLPRTINEPDMRVHAPPKELTLEERLARLEALLEERE